MKKFIFGSLFLALVGMGMMGCKKEVISNRDVDIVSNEFGVSTNGKMLVFNTIEDYMRAVDGEHDPNHTRILQIISNFNFDNYFTNSTISKKNQKERNEMDDFLGKLLNSNGCIEIENNIYKIDLEKEKVFVIGKDYYTINQEEFIDGNLQNIDVKVFNLNDDVLDMIKNEKFQEKASCLNPGTITMTSYTQGPFKNSYNIQTTVKLGAFGIYYRVTGRSKLLTSYNGYFSLDFILTVNNTQIHRRPCNNTNVTWHTVGTKATWINPGNNEQVWEAYSKAWNVKQMYMVGRTRGTFGAPWDAGSLIVETNDAPIIF